MGEERVGSVGGWVSFFFLSASALPRRQSIESVCLCANVTFSRNQVCGVLIAGLGRVFGSSASNEERPSWERERESERKGKEKAGAGLYSHQLALQDAAAATAVLEGKILVPVPSVQEVVSNNVYPGVPLKIQQLSAPPVATQQLTQQAQQPRTHSNVLGLQEAWSPPLPRPTFHPTSAALVQTQPQTQTETTTDFTAPDVDRGGEATDH